jgi:hypothetical protein
MDTPLDVEKNQSSFVIFIPLSLLAISWLLWTIFQLVMLISEGSNLKTLKANQENTVQQAVRLRAQLDSIAAKTAVLASKGNPGAKTIVDELRKRGVTINPDANKPTTTPAK